MKKRKIISNMLFLFVFCGYLYPQVRKRNLDQDRIYEERMLLNQIGNASNDSIKSILYFKLCDLNLKNNNEKLSKYYFSKAVKLIGKNEFLEILNTFYSVFYLDANKDSKRIKSLEITVNEKLKKYNSPEIYNLRARNLRNLAVSYQHEKKEEIAFNLLLNEAIPLAEKGNDNNIKYSAYVAAGIIAFNSENYILSEKLLKKGKKLFDEFPKEVDCYYLSEMLALARTLAINKKNEEGYELLHDLEKKMSYCNDNSLTGLFMTTEARFLYGFGKYEEALELLKSSLKFTQGKHYENANYAAKATMSNILQKLNRNEEALALLLEIQKMEDLSSLDRLELLKDLASVYKKLGNYKKAVIFYEKYNKAKTTADSIALKKEILQINEESKLRDKVNKIKLLNFEKKNLEATSRNNKLTSILFLFISILLGLIIIFIYQYYRKKRKVIEKQMKLLESEKELTILRALIEGEEKERNRISKELHDGIGSKLTFLKMMLSQNITSTNEVEEQKINLEVLDSSINEIRQISQNLAPESLLKLGLEKAISDFCHLIDSEHIKINFVSSPLSDTIPMDQKLNIYRIIQELLTNAVKHAQCSEIAVTCHQENQMIYITVQDNGIGINKEKIHQGLGIKNLINRVHLLKGTLMIDTTEKGTSIRIELEVNDSKIRPKKVCF